MIEIFNVKPKAIQPEEDFEKIKKYDDWFFSK